MHGATANMNRAAKQLQEADEYVMRQTLAAVKRCCVFTEHPKAASVKLSLLQKEDPFIQKRLLFYTVCEIAGRKKDITEAHIQSIYKLLQGTGSKECMLPYQVHVYKQYEWVKIEKSEAERGISQEKYMELPELPVDIPSVMDVPGLGKVEFRTFPCEKSQIIPQKTYTKSFVSAAVMALIIRARLNLLASVLVFLAVTLPMIYKGDGSAVWLMLGLVSVVLIMYVGNVHGNITADMYVHLGICMAVIAGLTMAVYMFMAYSPLQVVDDIKTNMQYHGENASGNQYYRLYQKFLPFSEHMYFIAENGSYIAEGATELYCNIIFKEHVEKVKHLISQIPSLFMILCGRKGAYILKRDLQYQNEVKKYYCAYTFIDSFDYIDDDIMKIAIYDTHHHIQNIIHDIQSQLPPEVKVVTSGNEWMDIQNKEAHKGLGMQFLQAIYDIEPDECVAFGDQMNDYELLQQVKYGYAMANAVQPIKDIAYEVIASNDEQGVIQKIKEILNEG